MTNPAYWGIEFSTWLFSLSNGTPNFAQPIWDIAEQRTDSLVSCMINPMRLSDLAPATSVVPSPTPTPSATSSPIGTSRDVTFQKGFNAFGNPGIVQSEMISGQGMVYYKFNDPANTWQFYPGGGVSFNTQTPEGSYVYNPGDAKTVRFMVGSTSVNTYELKKGLNLLWTPTDKTLANLNFYYSGLTTTASQLINSKTISDNIFIIVDDTARTACKYFKLLGSQNSVGSCAGGVKGLGSTDKIPAYKSFWVHVIKRAQLSSYAIC